MGLTGDGLVVRWTYRDTDQTGVLAVEARFGDFAGASHAWFSDDDLQLFADKVRTYPLGDQRFQVSGGYFAGPDTSLIEHVGLTVRAIGLRGQVGVIAHLAVPDDQVRYNGATASEVRIEVLTSYEGLGRFASELSDLIEGNLEEASLDAEIAGVD